MIKNDFGHLDSPYYQEILDNGMRIFILKTRSKLRSAILSVSCGGCLRVSEIMSAKIPSGTPYVLSKLIMDGEFRDHLAEKGIVASSYVDYSYVHYSLNSLGDVLSGVEALLNRILSFDYDEKKLDEFRRNENHDFLVNGTDPVLLSRQGALENLYSSALIRNRYLIDDNQLKLIHMNSVRKYSDAYYVPSNLAIFLSSDEDPKDLIEKIKKMKMPSPLTLAEKRITEKENYAKPVRVYSENTYSGSDSYLTVGIKFDAKKNIYQKYGDLYFYFNETILNTCFEKNDVFRDGLSLRKGELVKSSLERTGEDTCILLTIRCEDVRTMTSFLEDYLNHLDKNVSSSLFRRVNDDFYADALRSLSQPAKQTECFAKCDSDGLAYTQLVPQVMRVDYGSYRRFLSDISGYARAAYYLKKGC